mmetsp:Transcript_14036/g.21432  ORF Transcript_14036/g.21432 Transcript_14036/m.21432 type:complete len:1096 (+) Transcript_14036:226-3513(+)
MGVKGLWRLLLPIGRRISIEVLEGKVLAIDASIWLTQFLKAMRDQETGRVQPAAHLIGFFRRLAKLRYHGIRPVLVFDGATPLIKLRELRRRQQRREQFAPSSEAAFKRMAKRIFIQELKKINKLSNSKSVAPGFNLPNLEDAKESKNYVTTNVSDTGEGDLLKLQKRTNIGSDDSTSSVTKVAAINRISEGDRFIALKETSVQDEEFNRERIDNPISSSQNPTIESSEEIARTLQEEEWRVTYGDSEKDTQSDWSGEEKRSAVISELKVQEKKIDETISPDLDIYHLSNMTSNERKDTIENARRMQRMQSRKEFMSVAGQPESYSQTQLRNFLRSSRLNQNINKMAQEMAHKESSVGDQVASDPSRRIFFEKLDVKDATSSVLTVPKDCSDKDSGSNAEPEENSSKRFMLGKSANSSFPKQTFTLDSSHSSHKEGVKSTGCEDDSSESSEKGFSTSNERKEMIRKCSSTKTDKCIGLQRYSFDSISTSDSSQGGFIREPGIVVKPQTSGAQRNSVEFKLPSYISCANIDADLALETSAKEAINEIKVASASHTPAEIAAKREFVTVGVEDNLASASLPDSKTREIIYQKNDMPLGSDEDEDEESIDWIDGVEKNNTSDSSGFEQGNRLEIGNVAFLDSLKGEITQDVRGNGSMLPNSERSSNLESNEGFIDLVDGEESSHMSTSFDCKKRKNMEITDASVIVKDKTNKNEGETVEQSKKQKLDFALERGKKRINATALQQAESTAMNLTDWAGRAFRRAIAQHAKDSFMQSETIDEKASGNANNIETSKLNIEQKKGIVHENDKDRRILDNLSDETKDETKIIVEQSKSGPSIIRKTPKGSWDLSVSDNCVLNSEALLAEEEEKITQEIKRQNRDMDTITDEMKLEIISLIKLFGIPYVDAISEAEAQCVALEGLGLVDGIVTEDSDAFVFGAKTVYKNIFDDQKFVEVYKAEDASTELGLGKNQMVALAMLLGGDYTDGVKGVGIVNAMEILNVFDTTQNVKSGLLGFRRWLDDFDLSDVAGLPSIETESVPGMQAFHKAHKSFRTRWVCPKNFPADDVLKAYLNPVVDKSSDSFSWGCEYILWLHAKLFSCY